jgi:hypothetical protein
VEKPEAHVCMWTTFNPTLLARTRSYVCIQYVDLLHLSEWKAESATIKYLCVAASFFLDRTKQRKRSNERSKTTNKEVRVFIVVVYLLKASQRCLYSYCTTPTDSSTQTRFTLGSLQKPKDFALTIVLTIKWIRFPLLLDLLTRTRARFATMLLTLRAKQACEARGACACRWMSLARRKSARPCRS